jgi:hypothetical protein
MGKSEQQLRKLVFNRLPKGQIGRHHFLHIRPTYR